MLIQLAQLAGACSVLVAFILTQRSVISPDSRTSLWLNALGAAVLLFIALLEQMWGFAALEGVWLVVSAIGLLGIGRRRRPHQAGATPGT